MEKAIAKITGARLAWYATEEYSEQTHDSYLLHQYHCYICIPNRRIKLSIAEDGKYSVVYKLADDTFGNALNAAQIIYVNKLYDGGLKRLEDKYQEELLTVAMLSQISATNKIKLLETIHEASEVSKAALAEQKDKLIALAAEMSDMDIASEEFYQKNEAFLKELDKMEKLCGIA